MGKAFDHGDGSISGLHIMGAEPYAFQFEPGQYYTYSGPAIDSLQVGVMAALKQAKKDGLITQKSILAALTRGKATNKKLCVYLDFLQEALCTIPLDADAKTRKFSEEMALLVKKAVDACSPLRLGRENDKLLPNVCSNGGKSS